MMIRVGKDSLLLRGLTLFYDAVVDCWSELKYKCDKDTLLAANMLLAG